MRWGLTCILLLAPVFVLGGCGCGSDDMPPPPPTLTTVTPDWGRAIQQTAPNSTELGLVAAPGTEVELDGSGFIEGTAVSFGAAAATNIVVVDENTITCTAPAGPPGMVDVMVSNVRGVATLTDAFTYAPPPTLMAVEPGEGATTEETPVVLTGTGFTAYEAGANTVTFGGLGASNVVTTSDTQITCNVPLAVLAGAVDVRVTNANGATLLPSGYTYLLPPVTFEEIGAGTAGWSTENERVSGVENIRFTTPDASAAGKAILPYDGTLGEITTFSYWCYGSLDNYAPFLRIELDVDGDTSTAEIVLRAEPVFTTGWGALPASTWHEFDVLSMATEAWEFGVKLVDCPWDAPMMTDYITGNAMILGNFCADPDPWSTMAYGPLQVIEIAVMAGEGGPWPGFVGFADTITINTRTYEP